MNLPTLEDIKKTLEKLEETYEIVLYGSYIENSMRPTSDIDISVLTHLQDKQKNKLIQYDLFSVAPLKYDIRVFELLPIFIQISIIKNYKVIFGDPLEISEYFYYFRKKWDDCKNRILSNQFSSLQERLNLMKYYQ
ncbi:MAG: DNA polymerase subunit beta [Promethearchaeota archaeon]|nr:MAG: DNA polymerase subunit beta [Candidatus Lokiarchaeota archaeon]